MKRLALFLIVMLVAFESKAQDYFPMPTESATWSLIRTMVDPGPMDPSFISVVHYSIVGDTLVNDSLYHKVKLSNGGEDFSLENSYGNILFREDDSKRVWGIDDDVEFLLFDFNLNEGDTFCFEDQPSGYLCHEVLLVDSIEIDGEYRRQMHFESEGQEDIWVEGIGSLVYGLAGYWSFIGNFQDDLLCYRQSDLQIYGSCDFPSGIAENNIEEIGITLFPNPAASFIQIQPEIKNLHSFDLKIFNLLGELVQAETRINLALKVDISTLSKGQYTIVFSDENGQTYVGRFAKE